MLSQHSRHIAAWNTPISAVAGIYTHSYDAGLNARNGFPVFSTMFEANHVSKKEEQFAAYKLTQEDKIEIQELAKRPELGECRLRCSLMEQRP